MMKDRKFKAGQFVRIGEPPNTEVYHIDSIEGRYATVFNFDTTESHVGYMGRWFTALRCIDFFKVYDYVIIHNTYRRAIYYAHVFGVIIPLFRGSFHRKNKK